MWWRQTRIGLAVVAAIALGCGTKATTNEPADCEAGEIAPCDCVQGAGNQVCAADGTWGTCECSAGGSSGGGAGGVGGSGAGGGSGGSGGGGTCGDAGDVCADDTECCDGLICSTQNQCEG
jgi:hypothetical protein